MYKNKKEIFLVIFMFSLLTVFAFGYKFLKNKNEEKYKISETNNKEDDEKNKNKENIGNIIYVHIDGEVNKPNLYEMKNTDRIKDLIEKAGGLTKDADKSKINLAVKLKDEMKVHIYKIGEIINNKDSTTEDSSNKPNLYEMKNTDRIKDLIEKAGGLTKDADKSKINLAVKLKDEMKVHIYKIGEIINNKDSTTEDSSNSSSSTDKVININTANEQELCKLTGIGTTKAKAIIEYRKKEKFSKPEDITKVSGIGKKTFEKIKDQISVD